MIGNTDLSLAGPGTPAAAPVGLDDATRAEILRILRDQGHAQMVSGSPGPDVAALGYRPDVIAALRGTSLDPAARAPGRLPAAWAIPAPAPVQPAQISTQGSVIGEPDVHDRLIRHGMPPALAGLVTARGARSKADMLDILRNALRQSRQGGDAHQGGPDPSGPGPGAGPGSEGGGW